MSVPVLIKATEAISLADQGKAVFIDATFVLPNIWRDGKTLFAKEHIDGAVFFDIDEIADSSSSLPHTMPDAAHFESETRKLGINHDDHLIVYDNSPFLSSARAWWMFRFFGHERISVLNGGLKAWIEAGGKTASGAAQINGQGDFSATAPRETSTRLMSLEAMQELIATPPNQRKTQIVDARPFNRFSGESKEPRAGMESGHMPGALNLPVMTLLDSHTGHVKPPHEIKKLIEDAAIDIRKPVVTTCGSGVTACGLALCFALVDKHDVSMYDGSWSEWGSAQVDRKKCPISTGG